MCRVAALQKPQFGPLLLHTLRGCLTASPKGNYHTGRMVDSLTAFFSSTRRIIVPNLIIPCVKRYERALYNRQQNKRCAYGSGAAVETLRVTESTLLLRCRVVGVQSRLFIARRQTDSRVIATVNRTAHTLVLTRTPAAVRPTLRRTRGVGSN